MSSAEVQVRPRSSPLRCVVCHAPVRHATPSTCRCGVVAHRGCARALAACPSLGCTSWLAVPPLPLTTLRRRSMLAGAASSVAFAAAVICVTASTSAPPRTAVAPRPAPVATTTVADPLRSADPLQRQRAAFALGATLRTPSAPEARLRAVAALLDAAAHDPDASVRNSCDDNLADVDAELLAHLELALERDDPEVRLAAADLLGRVLQPWARAALLARVDPCKEPDARVRAVAAARLLSLDARPFDGGWDVVDALAARANDEPDTLVWVILRTGVNERDHASCALAERSMPVLIDAAARAPGRVGAACRDLLRGFGPCDALAPLVATSPTTLLRTARSRRRCSSSVGGSAFETRTCAPRWPR